MACFLGSLSGISQMTGISRSLQCRENSKYFWDSSWHFSRSFSVTLAGVLVGIPAGKSFWNSSIYSFWNFSKSFRWIHPSIIFIMSYWISKVSSGNPQKVHSWLPPGEFCESCKIFFCESSRAFIQESFKTSF